MLCPAIQISQGRGQFVELEMKVVQALELVEKA